MAAAEPRHGVPRRGTVEADHQGRRALDRAAGSIQPAHDPGSGGPADGEAIRALAHHLFETVSDAVLIADDEGRYVAANETACSLLGYALEDLLSMRVSDLVTVDKPDAGERYATYVVSGMEEGEFVFVRPDEGVRRTAYSARRLANGLHVSVLRDLGPAAETPDAAALPVALSPREREVLALLAMGLPYKTIAARLHISPRTVEAHMNRIKERAGLDNKAALIRFAVDHGITP